MFRRIPLKLTLRAFFLCVSLACAGQSGAATLPDSCGADNVKFRVKTEKNQAAVAGPAEGKAQIVFIENESQMIALSCMPQSASVSCA